jgi:hypothetical protein
VAFTESLFPWPEAARTDGTGATCCTSSFAATTRTCRLLEPKPADNSDGGCASLPALGTAE